MPYRPVLSVDSGWRWALIRDDDPDDAPGPVPQVYFCFEDERLRDTPLGVDAVLMRAFATPGCETIVSDGLPPMQDADVRAMLMDGLADAGHRLAAMDRDLPDADPDLPASNPFVQAVVRRARGAPIDVCLLLEDLRAGRRRIEDAPERLPATLADYDRCILAGQGVAFDIHAHLGLVLAILAAADEPLDRDALAGLFEPDQHPYRPWPGRRAPQHP